MRFDSITTRSALFASLTVLSLGCGDDGSVPGDTGTTDTGGSDTGGADTGAPDTGGADTGGADTGMADAGPTTCTPEASGISFPGDEWNAVVIADGATVDEPVGLDWDAAGNLVFSNSLSWIGGGAEVGNLLSLDGSALAVYATNDRFRGPAHVAWTGAIAESFEEGLYVAIEDELSEGGTDGIVKVTADGATVETFAVASEPGELEFGPGGDFGTDLYGTSRENNGAGAPNPYGVYRYASDGTATEFVIMDGSTRITGSWSLEFGPGGALGSDLYVGTLDDAGFSPDSMNAIYRVRASDGEATLFNSGTRPLAMAAPAPGTAFGEFLYVVSQGQIVRFDATGTGEMFATDIMASAGLRFGADGALYLAQPGAGRVLRITPCAMD